MFFNVLLLFTFWFGIVLMEALSALDHLIQLFFFWGGMMKDLSLAQFPSGPLLKVL